MSLLLQYLVIAAVVLPCAFYAVGVFSPRLKRRILHDSALWLLKPARPAPLRKLGLRLLPPEQAAGCGAGCSDCNNCAPPQAEQPLVDLRRR
jgi:hypothetical protein